jgi:nicotinamide riboside kinase
MRTACRSLLAAHYKTTWCPEYAREYLYTHGKNYSFEDLLEIAKGQLALEDNILLTAQNDIYFIDTNMYVMQVWCEYVYGKCHQYIIDTIVERRYDLYLLCNTDLPWSFDELREYPEEDSRKELFRYYRELMISQSTPWAEISGDPVQRLQKAIHAVNKVI